MARRLEDHHMKHLRSIVSLSVFLPTLVLVVAITAGTAKGQETVIYSEGFEGSAGGYLLDLGTTAEWEWGTPTGAIGPGSAHSGSKCWGTDLDNTLARTSEGSIISPKIQLPAINGTQLIRVRFWGYVDIDGMYDRAEFFISTDRVNWQSLMRMYNNMETSPSLAPSWKKYEFTLDPSYAGGPVYLRFRAAVPYPGATFYCGGGGLSELSGFYVDDIAITVFETSGTRKVFTLEAYEDNSTWASCPWVAPWTGKTYEADNDIYTVARGAANEYTDAYRVMKPLIAVNGVYPLQIQERADEISFTDYAALALVDHAPGVLVAPDQSGNLSAFHPARMMAPVVAISGAGENVLSAIAVDDDSGYPAYSGDTVTVTFPDAGVAADAVVVLQVKGFLLGEGIEKPYIGPPAVVVEAPGPNGSWFERGRLLPRFESSIVAIDLGAVAGPVTLRLRSISHSVKYHLIDYVGLQVGPQPVYTASIVDAVAAKFGSKNVLGVVSKADGVYQRMATGDSISLAFPAKSVPPGSVRDFVFVSRGYYVPVSGSYLIYTWDGANWVLRDSFTFPATDASKTFDLSLFLPDPEGEYKIRVWQDYQYEPAGIDYVAMSVGGFSAPLSYAHDWRTGADIYSLVLNSDNYRDAWSGCPRNRVTEFHFTPPGPVNRPPQVCPVLVSDTQPPWISWTYADAEGDAQVQFEVEIWTGPGGTGSIVWDPPMFTGTDTAVVYGGPDLPANTYYARVRANDGKDWSQWCEAEFGIARICGDLDRDGDVDLEDYRIFRGHYGKRAGQPGWIPEADYDGDGVGCLHDYQAWLTCYKSYLGAR